MDLPTASNQVQPIKNSKDGVITTKSSPPLSSQDIKNLPVYKNDRHTDQAFAAIHTMRNQNFFCDVILEADDDFNIEAHKMILAACSPYFYAMFTSFEEKDQRHVKLQGVDPLALELLVEYIYTAKIHITEMNVQNLLPAANLLQLTDVRDACCDFFRGQLDPSNCLGIRDFAEIHGCWELLKHVDEYIEDNFADLIGEEEFLALTPDKIVRLLRSDRLLVPSEEKVFEFVMFWIYFDVETRQNVLPELMEHIRLPLMFRDYLMNCVQKEPVVKANPQCENLVTEALEYHLLGDEEKSLIKSSRTRPRRRPKVLLVAENFKANETCMIECFDFKEKKWYQTTQLPTGRRNAGISVLDGRVYVVGGLTGSSSLRSVDIYDGSTNQWSKCADMKSPRAGHGVAVLNNCIYAVGGIDGQLLNTAEVYDPQKNEWQFIAPLTMRRVSIGLGVVDGLLYAVGGSLDEERTFSSVECYDPEKNEWKAVAPLLTGRRGAGVGVIDGIIYAVGGDKNEPPDFKSVEAYDPKTNQWSSIPDMTVGRKFAGVVTFDGMLYVVGGNDEQAEVTAVEVYSPENKSWTTLPNTISVGRCCPSVAIIDKPRVLLT